MKRQTTNYTTYLCAPVTLGHDNLRYGSSVDTFQCEAGCGVLPTHRLNSSYPAPYAASLEMNYICFLLTGLKLF